MDRPTKQNYYLKMAEDAAARGTCLRRNYGTIIVKNDSIVSTGYTGAPRGCTNCSDLGKCKRKELNIPSGERYELCRSVHSEANAIIAASRDAMLGSTLYLVGIDAETGKRIDKAEPCAMCKRMIINAGITDVVMSRGESDFVPVKVATWIMLDNFM